MNNNIKKDSFRKWNEEMAVKYNPEHFHSSKNIFIRWIEDKRVGKIVQSASVYKGKKVLEVGCGAGDILEKIPFDKLYGVDISESLLKRAKNRLNGKTYLSLANGEEMPFKCGSFDMVICTEVIEHTQNPEVLLGSIGKVLKPAGKLIISIPNEKLINLLKKIYFTFHWNLSSKGAEYVMSRKMDDEWHLHEFQITAFVNMLKTHFKIQRVYRVPYYLLPVRYIISCSKR